MRLPQSLEKQVSEVCDLLGMRKSDLVEEAVREKLEDLLNAYNLRSSLREASGHAPWGILKKNFR